MGRNQTVTRHLSRERRQRIAAETASRPGVTNEEIRSALADARVTAPARATRAELVALATGTTEAPSAPAGTTTGAEG